LPRHLLRFCINNVQLNQRVYFLMSLYPTHQRSLLVYRTIITVYTLTWKALEPYSSVNVNWFRSFWSHIQKRLDILTDLLLYMIYLTTMSIATIICRRMFGL
jgi:hypothetical protein